MNRRVKYVYVAALYFMLLSAISYLYRITHPGHKQLAFTVINISAPFVVLVYLLIVYIKLKTDRKIMGK